MEMRVLLADDQPQVRSALRLLLEEEPGLSVVDEVVSAGELLSRVEVTCPDLILLDWELPGLRPGETLPAFPSLSLSVPERCPVGMQGPEHSSLIAPLGMDIVWGNGFVCWNGSV